MKQFLLTTILLCYSVTASAKTPVTIFWYDEKESGTAPSHMRYLVGDQFIRIDEGGKDDNYVLFDAAKKKIYSVNHYDRTLMVIEHEDWQAPKFEFKHEVSEKAMHDAPQVAGKTVHHYRVRGDRKICTDVQYVPGLFPQRMALLQQYQQVLSGQLVRSLNNTPKEMHTPCFLADQVYNGGEYYARGLPIQIWHSRGYARLLTNYEDAEVDDDLFQLPLDYSEYHPYSE